MASMTKQDFVDLIRAAKSADSEHDVVEELLHSLSDDLHYIAVLARGFSEDELKKLESDPNGRFWK